MAVEHKFTRRRILVAVGAAAAVVVTAAALLVALSRDSDDVTGAPHPAPPASTTADIATTTTPTTSVSTTTSSQTRTPVPEPFAYQPLWPFADTRAAAAWQASYREGGHSPWHLDAEATALAFTTGYLGFTGIDRVLGRTVHGTEALVTVGFRITDHRPGVAAVLHLARIGTGADAPWEVVGTADTTLTLTTPRYGATVSTPLTVGGRITGVDESIRVQVREPDGLLGESCCVPAGGNATPWTATVGFRGGTGAALTVVASTGGHVTDVERFAITGVVAARRPA